MLVSLYRGNPQAFIDNNMNRLKAGIVLNLPDAAAAKEVAPDEARQVIQAHSADFAAFRQRLAGAAPTVKGTEPARQATGQVQAAVKDRKADSGPASPDKLTLSQARPRSVAPRPRFQGDRAQGEGNLCCRTFAQRAGAEAALRRHQGGRQADRARHDTGRTDGPPPPRPSPACRSPP
jgi:pilus assembly protein FimV